jgi:hypothetical protein
VFVDMEMVVEREDSVSKRSLACDVCVGPCCGRFRLHEPV